MLRDEYLRRLTDEAHVELYLSANDGGRLYWPWRMQPPSEANTKYRNSCEQYIIDSDPLDESVDTRDVLDTAYGLNAEVASLVDVYQDCDGTVDSLLRGMEIVDDHEFDGKLLLPLQQPYVKCYREIGEPDELIGLGGLKDAQNKHRIKATRELREYAGPDVWLHGFGWGPTDGLAKAIRQEPGLLDSLDYSTPMQSVDYTTSTPGDERMTVAAMQAAQQLVRDLREVSSYPRKATPEDLRPEGQESIV